MDHPKNVKSSVSGKNVIIIIYLFIYLFIFWWGGEDGEPYKRRVWQWMTQKMGGGNFPYPNLP